MRSARARLPGGLMGRNLAVAALRRRGAIAARTRPELGAGAKPLTSHAARRLLQLEPE